MSLKSWILRWLTSNENGDSPKLTLAAARPNSIAGDDRAHTRYTVIPCSNGLIIEEGIYRPNPRGPDWTNTLHIVGPDETPGDVIERLLIVQKLEGK